MDHRFSKEGRNATERNTAGPSLNGSTTATHRATFLTKIVKETAAPYQNTLLKPPPGGYVTALPPNRTTVNRLRWFQPASSFPQCLYFVGKRFANSERYSLLPPQEQFSTLENYPDYLSRVRLIDSSGFMERAMGIEPTSEAWEAYLKARQRTNWRHFCVFRCLLNGFQLEQRAVPVPMK